MAQIDERGSAMPGKFYYGFKRFLARVGILAIMLAVVAFFAYVYVLPTVSPEVITNPKRIMESPERQRIYEITDEFIGTYAYVQWKSDVVLIGSEEWLRSTLETLRADKASFSRLDPLQTEGRVVKAYNNLVDMEIRLLRQYADLYQMEIQPDSDDVGIGEIEIQWDQLLAYYEEFKAADAEYQAQLNLDQPSGAGEG